MLDQQNEDQTKIPDGESRNVRKKKRSIQAATKDYFANIEVGNIVSQNQIAIKHKISRFSLATQIKNQLNTKKKTRFQLNPTEMDRLKEMLTTIGKNKKLSKQEVLHLAKSISNSDLKPSDAWYKND